MVQGNCTPNLDQIFEQLLFRRDHFYSCSLISLFKISNYNSTPPPLRGPLNKINNRYDTIFSFWGWTIKCPRKPYTKFGPDIQRTCHAIRSLSLPVYNSTHHCAMSYRTSIRQKRGSPLSQVDYLWSKATAHQIWTKYSNNFYSGGTTFTHVLLFHYSKFQITIRPPPVRGPLNKIENR